MPKFHHNENQIQNSDSDLKEFNSKISSNLNRDILNIRTQKINDLKRRIIVDGSDHVSWLKARSKGVTATDVAKLSTENSIKTTALAKLNPPIFTGNIYTRYGKQREPIIAKWVQEEYKIYPSSGLFHAHNDIRHLATPDGIAVRENGIIELAEIKTTNKAWKNIPKSYLRQIWWQQYVLGAERTLIVWEMHKDFVPVSSPKTQWIDRDEYEVNRLISLANSLIDEIKNILS